MYAKRHRCSQRGNAEDQQNGVDHGACVHHGARTGTVQTDDWERVRRSQGKEAGEGDQEFLHVEPPERKVFRVALGQFLGGY
jgi:hypothetical protein